MIKEKIYCLFNFFYNKIQNILILNIKIYKNKMKSYQ